MFVHVMQVWDFRYLPIIESILLGIFQMYLCIIELEKNAICALSS